MNSKSSLVNWAGISGAIAVILGAFGAHGLERMMTEHYLDIFNTGVRYQIYHTLAILAASTLASDPIYHKRIVRACRAWFIGIAIFSGSLYLLAFTQAKWLGMITPFGGIAFIIGWLLLISWKSQPDNIIK